MKRFIMAGFLLLTAAPFAFGASNLYKMRSGQAITTMGLELVNATNQLCERFAVLQLHLTAMTQQRNDTTDFTTVAAQWGVVDPTTDALCEACTEAMYAELNSMIGNGGPSVLQWCARIRQ